jgi:hypothetical protein
VTSPSDPSQPPAEPGRARSLTPVPLARRTNKPSEPAPPGPQPVPRPEGDPSSLAEPLPSRVPLDEAGAGDADAPADAHPAGESGPADAGGPVGETARPDDAAPAAAPPPETPAAPGTPAGGEKPGTAAGPEAAEDSANPFFSPAYDPTFRPDEPLFLPADQPDPSLRGTPRSRISSGAPRATSTRQTPAAPSMEKPGTPEKGPADVTAGGVPVLTHALGRLRDTLISTRFTLRTPTAERATTDAAAALAQLDDYLLPRLSRLDAPLLVVVGGSTGAGKSTLVNSLVRAPVSTPGVLRPTTRAPVLVCNPADASWFGANQLLPGLTRSASPSNDPDSLQVVTAPGLTPGLAFLDAPDIDSVVEANRTLAGQLLAAADLWLFVTTAARYADAVPWGLLRTARERGTVVALVLDRVPPGAADEIGPHLTGMLRENDLGSAPLFVLPETSLDGQGLLAERVILPLRAWFDRLASSAAARSAVVRQTVGGAVDALQPTVGRLAAAADDQVSAVQALDEAVRTSYREAYQAVEKGMRDGVLLRGEVLARWQELVGTGDLMRALQARIGRARDRVVAAVTGRPAPGRQFQAALESGVATLIRSAGADAAERTAAAWRAHPAGRELVTSELAFPSPELTERAERLVRDWQRHVLELVREEAQGKLALAKATAYAVNATGLLVMVSVFAATAFIPTGAEVATAAGTTIAAQKVLEAIFGDQAVRSLAELARTDLLKRVRTVLNAEADRFDLVRASTGVDIGSAQRLRDASAAVATARRVTDLPAHATAELPRLALNGSTTRPALDATTARNGTPDAARNGTPTAPPDSTARDEETPPPKEHA